YGLGNLGSIINMFRRIGVNATLTSSIDEIQTAQKILLPGVGAFDSGMKLLKEKNLLDILNSKVLEDKTPIMGICLGMQLLTKGSDEGTEKGFGWIDANTVSMKDRASPLEGLKFPHIGWNYIDAMQDHPVCRNLPE